MPIPQSVAVSTAVAQRQAYRGELPVYGLARLRSLLADDAGTLRVDLQADAARGQELLTGTIDAGLMLVCQRCMQPFAWPLHVDLDLRLVRSDAEEEAVLQQADPYRVEDDRLPLHELVEDEALLSLPMLPRCESCENAAQRLPEDPTAVNVQSRDQVQNPFAALKERLDKQK